MVIGVVGLGSMGKRRLRLLRRINEGFDIVGIDAREDRRREAEDIFGIETAGDLGKAIDEHGVNAVVISTSPLSHAAVIRTALGKGCHVFTELNLVDDGYKENMDLAEQRQLTLFLSSTMMFREEVAFIKNAVSGSSLPVNYIYHVGQFLPTWHTWESYKDFFVADKRTNGCREVFAIELPWIVDVFGEIVDFEVRKGRMTDLDIDYPDNYELIITHEGGNRGTLNVNVASLHAVRNLEVYGQECYIRWHGTPDSLLVYDQENNEMRSVELYDDAENINDQNRSIVENAYEKELVEYFEAIEGSRQPKYSFEKDGDILSLIDRIEGGDESV